MKIADVQPWLRGKLAREIDKGRLSVSYLTHHTGLRQSHISNFLKGRRGLSLHALDRLLSVLRIEATDLLNDPKGQRHSIQDQQTAVPIVSMDADLFQPVIHPRWIEAILALPSNSLVNSLPHDAGRRYGWLRYVAIHVTPENAEWMHPLLLPRSLAIIDRRYTSLKHGHPSQLSPYALHTGSQLTISYVEFVGGVIVARPHNARFTLQPFQVDSDRRVNDYIVGRVTYVLNPT